MKTRSESTSEPPSKSKGGGAARQARSSQKSGLSGEAYDSLDSPREQMIAEAAYFYAERRGFAPGNEMSDWLQAEADVESVHSSRRH